MERMNALDAGFYYAEHERTPLHIASVAILEGPPPAQPDVERMVLARLHEVPRYRQRVRTVPFDLGRPVWADDPRFQIEYHLRRTAVPHPGGPEEFSELIGRVLGHRLDLSRPPWEIWIVEGLEGGHWAVIAKVHHCVVDGVAGSDLIASLFDLKADRRAAAQPLPWSAAPEPSLLALVLGSVCDSITEPARQLTRLPGLVRRGFGGLHVPGPPRLPTLPTLPALPGLTALPGLHRSGHAEPEETASNGPGAGNGGTRLNEFWDYTTGLPQMAENIAHHGISSLSGPIGPHRRWAWTEVDLDQVKAVRRRYGATINDVVLAVVSRGFRDLLDGRGELTGQAVVRALVPVSLRAEDEHGILNNRVSGLVVALPCGEADAARRLEIVRTQMEELRRTHQEVSVDALIRLAGFSPPTLSLVSRATRAAIRPVFQTIVTNVPGPQVPLYVLGRKLISLYPYVPIAAGAGVSVGIFSYQGRLFFGITGDFDAFPDLEVLTAGIDAGVAELLEPARSSRAEPETGAAG